jgi:hypothetical protein
LAAVAGTTQKRAITGYITASDGTPIQGVLVIASGESFHGWTESHTDDSFKLPAAGAFVTFRHADFQPLLLRSSDFIETVHVQMRPRRDCAEAEAMQPDDRNATLMARAVDYALRLVSSKLESTASTIRIGTFGTEGIGFMSWTVISGIQVFRGKVSWLRQRA